MLFRVRLLSSSCPSLRRSLKISSTMAGASLLALLDDIASVLDDVALLTKAATKWRMEVIPPERKDDEIFLHVLSTDGKPDATLLESRDAGVKIPLLRPAAAHQTQRLLDLFAH